MYVQCNFGACRTTVNLQIEATGWWLLLIGNKRLTRDESVRLSVSDTASVRCPSLFSQSSYL